MEMFENLGRALGLVREMRGYSQLFVSRQAKIGKSQLSKYERGRELPKLETLEKILAVLEVPPLSFFYTVAMLDGLAAKLDDREPSGIPPLLVPLTTLQPELDEAFVLTLHQLLRVYHLQVRLQTSPSFQRLLEDRPERDGDPRLRGRRPASPPTAPPPRRARRRCGP